MAADRRRGNSEPVRGTRARVANCRIVKGHDRGRPPLPPEVARKFRVVTMVTATEKAELDRLAASRSLSLSAICHELIVDALRSLDK